MGWKRLAFMVCFPVALASLPITKNRGALTHAPLQARECPHRNAFSTPEYGRAESALSCVEISRFVVNSG